MRAHAIACALILTFAACSDDSGDSHGSLLDAATQDGGPADAPSDDSSPADASSDANEAGASTTRRVLAAPGEGSVYPGWYSHDVHGEFEPYNSLMGGSPKVIFTFHDWNGAGTASGQVSLRTFDTPLEGSDDQTVLDAARMAAEAGSILALAWDAVGYVGFEESYWKGELELAISFQDILDGKYDAYIRTCAEQVRDLDVPVMLSPFAEIDSITWFMFGPDELTPLETVDDPRVHYGDPTLPDGPERLRDAYRHVVDIFREEQVANVTWFMYAGSAYMGIGDKSPEEIARLDEVHPRFFYPGDDYVDWIGTSLYVESGVETLGDKLDTGMTAWRQVTQRPFFAPELGVVASGGQDRTAAIAGLVDALPSSGVQIVGFADTELYALIFDVPRLDDNPSEAQAWRAVMSDPRYAQELVFETR
ncbi:MAG: hypothetical protein ACOC1F_03720 [Myxococcota bacterium]